MYFDPSHDPQVRQAPQPEVSVDNQATATVMVEQEKFDAPLARYIDRLGRNPFERDIITTHSRVKTDLARLWPKTNDDGRQARRLWNIIDDVVQGMPQTTPQILVRVSSSQKPFSPSAPPVPKEKIILLTFDTKQYSLLHYDVPPNSEAAITPDMGIPSGLMVMCQRILPLQNAFKDTRPLGTGPGASLFNVNEKDKPEENTRDLVLNPPDTSSPGMRPPNAAQVPPYLTRVDYPYGIYVRDENGGHPILKAEAEAIAVSAFFDHERKKLAEKARQDQEQLQKKNDEEKRLAAIAGVTHLSEEQKREEARNKAHQAEAGQTVSSLQTQPKTQDLGTLAKQEMAAQAEVMQENTVTLPQRPKNYLSEASMEIIPVEHIGTDAEPDGYQIDAVGIPIMGDFDSTQTMPIMPGGEGPANAVPINAAHINVAELNQDTDRVEGEPDTGPETGDALASMQEASNEIVAPEGAQPANEIQTNAPSEGVQTTTNDQSGENISAANEKPSVNEAATEMTEPAQTRAPETGNAESASPQEQPQETANQASPNEPARNNDNNEPGNENSRQQDSQQEPDQSNSSQENRQATEDRGNETQGNENQGTENRDNESQSNKSQGSEDRGHESQDNNQSRNEDSSRHESHADEQNSDRQDSSRQDETRQDETRQDGGQRDNPDPSQDAHRSESQPSHEQNNGYHGDGRDENSDSNNDQNQPTFSHDAFEAFDLAHHVGLGHADVLNGMHAGVHSAMHAGLHSDWVTMPAHHVADHLMGNTMLHTHHAAMAASNPTAAMAHASIVTSAPASTMSGNVTGIKMPASAGLGMLPFALNHTAQSPTGFVTSQRNQQWHDVRKKEAMKYNYAPQGMAVHPAAPVPHQDLTPDM